jgi:predicted phosphodiesterase
LRFTWEGKKICLAHGAPWASWQYVYPVSGRHIIHRVVDEARSDIVILGHTHTPMQLLMGETYILNAGSLAYNRTNYEEQTCGILTLPDFSFRIYDLATGYSSTLETKIIPG